MSGPKTSHYSLTPEQRRILEEQRKCQREHEIMLRRLKQMRSILSQADQIIQESEVLWAGLDAESEAFTLAKNLQSAAKETLEKASGLTPASGLSALQEINQQLQECQSQLSTVQFQLRSEYESTAQTFRKEMGDKIHSGFSLSFESLGKKANSTVSNMHEKILAELAKLELLHLSDALRERIGQIREAAMQITNADFLKNYQSMTVATFARSCREYDALYQKIGGEYERKILIYQTNAEALGLQPEDIPFAEDAIAKLDQAIAQTEEAIRFQEEQAYISRCVDEAMQEMGYQMLGNREIVKRSGKRFRNELYLFEEGTAVNVTFSSDGQITMELGGMDTGDRMPTREESAALEADMQSFCEDYREIERRLRQKGIVTTRISVLPADAKYAQIINVSDYQLSGEVSAYEVRSQRAETEQIKKRKVGSEDGEV